MESVMGYQGEIGNRQAAATADVDGVLDLFDLLLIALP